jgi:hypothetical protein
MEATVTPDERTEASVSPKSAAARFVQAFAEGWANPIDADQFCAHFEPWLHPDVRLVQPQVPTITGYRAFREQFARPLFTLMPDLRGTVESWAARGDTLYIEIRLHGTLGRRPVTLRSCDRITLGEDGRAIERVAYIDPLPLLAAAARTPRAWPRMLRQQLSARRQPR